jgi:hypothetical protein
VLHLVDRFAEEGDAAVDTVSVRHIVDDVVAAVAFYTEHLGFGVDIDGSPGGRLRAAGVRFRNDVVVERGGSQILLEDPAGNMVELFQPASR